MKSYLFLTALVLFLSYCTGDNHKADQAHKHGGGTTTSGPDNAAYVTKESKLTLNNGQKWKLDEPTRKNMGEIKSIVDKAVAQPVPDYNAVAADLQASTDKLIGECRMSGPDHDALHLWLEDYLPALKELHATNKPMQKTAFHTIHSQVTQFDKYFE